MDFGESYLVSQFYRDAFPVLSGCFGYILGWILKFRSALEAHPPYGLQSRGFPWPYLYVHVMVTFTSTSCSMGTGSVMTIRLTITVIIVGLRERKGYYGASSTTLDIEIRLSLDRSWLVERPVGILIA